MFKGSRYLAVVLSSAMVLPAPALAEQTLAQQVHALQLQMQHLAKENARDRQRIKALERSRQQNESSQMSSPNVVTAEPAVYQSTPSYLDPLPSQNHYVEASAPSTSAAHLIAPPPIAQQTYGKAAPTANAVKAVYQQENALFSKGLTLTPAATYTYGDNRFFTLNGFMALGAIFLGNINVSRQQNALYEPNLNIAYGASNRLQFDATVPFVYRSSMYSSQGAQSSTAQISERSTHSGSIGDVNFGLYYQLAQHSLGSPATILSAHITAPTGISPYGIKVYQDTTNNNLSYVEALPTGQGAWGLQLGATMIKTLDPAVVFGGVNLAYNLPQHYNDISPYVGITQPGTIQPGGSLSFTIGTAFSLNDRMSTSFSFQDSMVQPLRERPDGLPWTNVVGSALNAAVFNIGATYAVSKNLSYQTVLAIGLTQDAPNFQLTFRVPHVVP